MLLGPASISAYRHHTPSFDFKKAQQEIEAIAKTIKRVGQKEEQPHAASSTPLQEKEVLDSGVPINFDNAKAYENTAQRKYHSKRFPAPQLANTVKHNLTILVEEGASARNTYKKQNVSASHNRESTAYPLQTDDGMQALREQIGVLNLQAATPNYQTVAQLGRVKTGLHGNTVHHIDSLQLYTPLQAQQTAHAQACGELLDKVRAFLDSSKKVLLLLGEAGSGKSTFNRHLIRTFWAEYAERFDMVVNAPIPIFISVDTYNPSGLDWVESYLRDHQFSQATIDTLREKNRFIFIVEGLDAMRDPTHKLGLFQVLDRWKARIVVSARPSTEAEEGYLHTLQSRAQAGALQTYWLAPLSEDWIHNYIHQYIQYARPIDWDVARYQKVLAQAPALKAALRQPFLLHLALEVLPAYESNPAVMPTTVIELYDQWMAQWWARCDARLQGITFTRDEREAFSQLQHFLPVRGLYASQRMAIALTKARAIQALYDPKQDAVFPAAWRQYVDNEAEKRLVLFSMPLLRQGSHYRFIHPGIQSYLVASAICGPEGSTVAPHVAAVLNQLSLVDEPVILDFLIERVTQFPELKEHFHTWIEASKTNEQLGIGAANAMTILVRMGHAFTKMDLRDICIAGADLRHGIFDHVDLQRADLRNVRAEGIWLRNTRLNETLLDGAQFGAFPFLMQKGPVKTCLYAPNGAYLAVGVDGNPLHGEGAAIYLYQTCNWKRIHTFTLESAHIEKGGIAFSADSERLAVVDIEEGMVRRWQIPFGREIKSIYTDNANRVLSIAFAPGTPLLAMQVEGVEGSQIELRNIRSREKVGLILQRFHRAQALLFAPNGRWLAIAGQGVQLWDMHKKTMIRIFSSDTFCHSVAFSPDSRWLALCEEGNRLSLWHRSSGACMWTTGYGEGGTQVAFSPNGQLIATVSAQGGDSIDGEEMVIRLWHADSGALFYVQKGHTDAISDLSFSPDGTQLVSSSMDKTIRLWKVPAQQAQPRSLAGHTQTITGTAFSSDGGLLATCSEDRTICLWEMPTGRLVQYFVRNKADQSGAQALHFSPDDQWLAVRDKQSGIELYAVQKESTLVPSWPDFSAYGVEDAVFSPDGKKVAHKKREFLALWNIRTQKKYKDLYIAGLHRLVFSDESQHILAVCINHGMVSIHDVEGDVVLQTFKDKNAHFPLVDAVYAPSSQQLATAHTNHTVALWDAHSGKKGPVLYGHTHTIKQMNFSPDGTLIATRSDDRTLRIWNTSSGECVGVVQIGSASITSMAWHVDIDKEAYIATGSDDAIARLWQIQAQENTYSIVLWWASGQSALITDGACLEHAQGLSATNRTLLVQHGALLREQNKAVLTPAHLVKEKTQQRGCRLM